MLGSAGLPPGAREIAGAGRGRLRGGGGALTPLVLVPKGKGPGACSKRGHTKFSNWAESYSVALFAIRNELFQAQSSPGAGFRPMPAKGSDTPFDPRIHALRRHSREDPRGLLPYGARRQQSHTRVAHEPMTTGVQDPYCSAARPR